MQSSQRNLAQLSWQRKATQPFVPGVQSVHLTSHFKYSGAGEAARCVSSPMLSDCLADYFRNERAMPAEDSPLFSRHEL